ncbi:MAG: hypothetical protein RL422_645 [Bacteroidota bacterium]
MSHAQKAPALDFFCELKVKLDPALIVGETPHGTRRIIPIIGGTVEGPKIKGEILNGGADWQILRADGVTELEAHYQFRTDDGTLIYVKNTGIRAATPEIAARLAKGEKVDANEYYFRAMPKFDAPKGKYDWVNNSLFVCTGERLPDYVLIRVWKVM